jgi:Elongation factor P, C-terminal
MHLHASLLVAQSIASRTICCLACCAAGNTYQGFSANAMLKPATVTGGARIKVPPYVAVGDKVVLNTADMSFVKRA